MKVVALFDVDEEKLDEIDSEFSTEAGWMVESGIILEDWVNVDDDYSISDLIN